MNPDFWALHQFSIDYSTGRAFIRITPSQIPWTYTPANANYFDLNAAINFGISDPGPSDEAVFAYIPR